jgi:hypothetical protein
MPYRAAPASSWITLRVTVASGWPASTWASRSRRTGSFGQSGTARIVSSSMIASRKAEF